MPSVILVLVIQEKVNVLSDSIGEKSIYKMQCYWFDYFMCRNHKINCRFLDFTVFLNMNYSVCLIILETNRGHCG